MIDISTQSLEPRRERVAIDRDKTIVIIGEGETNKKINQVEYYNLYEEVKEMYGECDLSLAFKQAKEIGVPHVFVVNIKRKEDYIDLIELLKQHDFGYICPLNLRLSDYFYDLANDDKKTYYIDYFNRQMNYLNNSTIVVTEKHASLYEDIDHFIDDMKDKLLAFKNILNSLFNGRNTYFVANNLKDYHYANIALASALCSSELNQYPRYNYGEAIFDIDSWDIGLNEIIYFKNHNDINTTVDNLVNLKAEVSPEKIIMIDRVLKYIVRKINLEQFIGRNMRAHTKLQIERTLEEFFNRLIDFVITRYEILNINFVKDIPGSGRVEVLIDIWAIGSLEKVTVKVEA